jgi:hypothetical protein
MTKTLNLLDVRYWLEAAKAKGASIGGVGITLNPAVADIDIELEGRKYNISIKELKDDCDDCT